MANEESMDTGGQNTEESKKRKIRDDQKTKEQSSIRRPQESQTEDEITKRLKGSKTDPLGKSRMDPFAEIDPAKLEKVRALTATEISLFSTEEDEDQPNDPQDKPPITKTSSKAAKAAGKTPMSGIDLSDLKRAPPISTPSLFDTPSPSTAGQTQNTTSAKPPAYTKPQTTVIPESIADQIIAEAQKLNTDPNVLRNMIASNHSSLNVNDYLSIVKTLQNKFAIINKSQSTRVTSKNIDQITGILGNMFDKREIADLKEAALDQGLTINEYQASLKMVARYKEKTAKHLIKYNENTISEFRSVLEQFSAKMEQNGKTCTSAADVVQREGNRIAAMFQGAAPRKTKATVAESAVALTKQPETPDVTGDSEWAVRIYALCSKVGLDPKTVDIKQCQDFAVIKQKTIGPHFGMVPHRYSVVKMTKVVSSVRFIFDALKIKDAELETKFQDKINKLDTSPWFPYFITIYKREVGTVDTFEAYLTIRDRKALMNFFKLNGFDKIPYPDTLFCRKEDF